MRAGKGDYMSKLFGTRTSSRVDTKEIFAFFKRTNLTEQDMLNIEKPGALTVVNTQRTLVPVDTGATKAGIIPEIQFSSETLIVDDVGPQTDYSEFIEFGVISKPNYPIQPFVRPSVMGAGAKKFWNAIEFAFRRVVESK